MGRRGWERMGKGVGKDGEEGVGKDEGGEEGSGKG